MHDSLNVNTVAYAKDGSIDWEGFHCLGLPSQMVVGSVPVTFCFTVNWTGPNDGTPAIRKPTREPSRTCCMRQRRLRRSSGPDIRWVSNPGR